MSLVTGDTSVRDSGDGTAVNVGDSSNKAVRVNVVAGAGSGGTASNFSAAFPSSGTAAGASDGANMQPLLVDGSGNLKVNVSAGGTSGQQYADGDARGTSTGTLAMGDDGTNIQSVKVDASGVLAVQDNGGSITVDGAVSFTAPQHVIVDSGGGGGVQFADGAARGTATGTLAMGDDGTNIQSVKVDSSGVLAIQDNGGSITVDGTVAVSNFPATQPVSGTVAATQSGTWTVQPGNTANTTAWKVDASSVAVPVTDNSGSLTVDGSVSVSNFPATQPVSGTVAATQSGTWTVQPGNTANTTAWKVDASSVAVPITDNGGSLTVDGAISFTAPQHVIVDSGAGSGVQFADGAARGTATGTLAMGDDGTNIQSVKVDSSGVLAVQDNSGSITVDAPVGTPLFARLSDGAAALIGQKVMASSLPIVIASDQTAILVNGDVDHDAVNTLKNIQIAGNASPYDVAPTAVSANGDRVRAWLDRYGAQIIRTRKIRESYTAVFRLDGSTAGRVDQTFTQVANTDKQWATIYHTVSSTKDVRIMRVVCYITAWSAASQGLLEIRSLSGITAPATGNPAITPTPRRFGGSPVAAECTCLYLPTTQGSINSVNSVFASMIFDLGIMGAASAANPMSPIEQVLYDATRDDPEVLPPTLGAGAGLGFAVTLRTVGTPAVRMTVVVIFTEELP